MVLTVNTEIVSALQTWINWLDIGMRTGQVSAQDGFTIGALVNAFIRELMNNSDSDSDTNETTGVVLPSSTNEVVVEGEGNEGSWDTDEDVNMEGVLGEENVTTPTWYSMPTDLDCADPSRTDVIAPNMFWGDEIMVQFAIYNFDHPREKIEFRTLCFITRISFQENSCLGFKTFGSSTHPDAAFLDTNIEYVIDGIKPYQSLLRFIYCLSEDVFRVKMQEWTRRQGVLNQVSRQKEPRIVRDLKRDTYDDPDVAYMVEFTTNGLKTRNKYYPKSM